MNFEPIELLQRLIRIPSVNPMGREENDPTTGEGRLTDFFARVSKDVRGVGTGMLLSSSPSPYRWQAGMSLASTSRRSRL